VPQVCKRTSRPKTSQHRYVKPVPSTKEQIAKGFSYEVSAPQGRLLQAQEGLIDYQGLNRLFKEAKIEVNDTSVSNVIRYFKEMSPGRLCVDSNQFDVIMAQMGVQSAYLRLRIFETFDEDSNKVIDFHEFIWGMSMLVSGSLAIHFQRNWEHMCRNHKYTDLNLRNGGSLGKAALKSMITNMGYIKDEELINAMVSETLRRLDKDDNHGVDYEELQAGIIEDTTVQMIFRACLIGMGISEARICLGVPLPEQIQQRMQQRPKSRWEESSEVSREGVASSTKTKEFQSEIAMGQVAGKVANDKVQRELAKAAGTGKAATVIACDAKGNLLPDADLEDS